MQNFKSMLVKMSNLELCCDYYLRTFMFYSTNFGNKLHVLSFLFLAFVLFFTPFLLMNRNCWCYRNKAKGLQNNSGPMLSLKLTFIAISCAQSETVEEKSYSALLLTAAERCNKKKEVTFAFWFSRFIICLVLNSNLACNLCLQFLLAISACNFCLQFPLAIFA